MYEKFYKLKEKPFQITPNPSYLYMSPVHENALTYLEYGLMESLGFILLTGEVGTGKTTLVRHIVEQVESEKEIGVIFNTNVTVDELLYLILQSFEIEPEGRNKARNLEILQRFLIEQYAKDKQVLLIIDEAQNLSNKSLEEVRMISNLQSDDQNLMQIMLVGQPELKARLQQPNNASFSQRIAVNIFLSRLTKNETKSYIAYRLEKADGRPDIFDMEAIDMIYNVSNGIPRTINLLCDTALVYGFADGLEIIDASVIKQVIADKGGIGLNDVSKNGEISPSGSSEHEIRKVERDQFENLEDAVRLLQGKVDSLVKFIQDKVILSEVIEELIRNFATPLKPEDPTPIEPPSSIKKPPTPKSRRNRWPALVLICCLLFVLGYFLGVENVFPKFGRLSPLTNIQKTYKIAESIKSKPDGKISLVEQEKKSGNDLADTMDSRPTSHIATVTTSENDIHAGTSRNQNNIPQEKDESIKRAQMERSEANHPESHPQNAPDHSHDSTQVKTGVQYETEGKNSIDNHHALLVLKSFDDQMTSSTNSEFEITATPPPLLGQIVIRPSDTLSSLIREVYGVFTIPYLSKVQQANPDLINANSIEAEDIINFPTIPIKIKPGKNETWWIRLETKQELQAAMQALKNHPAHLPPARMIPFWRRADGIRFNIIVDDSFQSKLEAQKAIEKFLKHSEDKKYEVVNLWDPGTVFISNPFVPIRD